MIHVFENDFRGAYDMHAEYNSRMLKLVSTKRDTIEVKHL